jgi:hypothetical protein
MKTGLVSCRAEHRDKKITRGADARVLGMPLARDLV